MITLNNNNSIRINNHLLKITIRFKHLGNRTTSKLVNPLTQCDSVILSVRGGALHVLLVEVSLFALIFNHPFHKCSTYHLPRLWECQGARRGGLGFLPSKYAWYAAHLFPGHSTWHRGRSNIQHSSQIARRQSVHRLTPSTVFKHFWHRFPRSRPSDIIRLHSGHILQTCLYSGLQIGQTSYEQIAQGVRRCGKSSSTWQFAHIFLSRR